MTNEMISRQELSSVNNSSRSYLASSIDEKQQKVTVLGEEHEAEETQEQDPPSTLAVEIEEPTLTPEQVKEFFKATEEGSVERLDALFDKTTIFEPNMTQFTETLLMAAIRAKQQKVAEYLIDQWGINVDHTSELLEFNTRAKIPIRERALSSRDLAYDEGMMDLVDLIDIAGNELKPSTKRFLQRRLKTSLDDIHQAYLVRLKERNDRLPTPLEETIIEEIPVENIPDSTDLPSSATPPPPPPPPPPPVVERPYKSHLDETIQSIQSPNDKSIEESGKKYFRFSGYTLRYRLVDIKTTNKPKQEPTRPKPARRSLLTIPRTTSRLYPSSVSKSKSTTIPYFSSHSLSEISTHLPIHETRTSICRSALHRPTPRLVPPVIFETISDIKPPRITNQRSSPQRLRPINTNYGYTPPQQSTVYNVPRYFIPVTLKTTAVGLPSHTPIIRD